MTGENRRALVLAEMARADECVRARKARSALAA